MNPLKKSPKISHNFVCESCNYKCSKLSEYNKHLSTNKHKILQNPTHLNNQKAYTCSCGKKYKHMSSLCNHKRLCTGIKILKTETNVILSETNDKIDHVSKIFLFELVSSPLRIIKVNIPFVKSVFVTSQRIFDADPVPKAPADVIEPELLASAP